MSISSSSHEEVTPANPLSENLEVVSKVHGRQYRQCAISGVEFEVLIEMDLGQLCSRMKFPSYLILEDAEKHRRENEGTFPCPPLPSSVSPKSFFISKGLIESGLQLPLSSFVISVLNFYHLCPAQLTGNSYTLLRSIERTNSLKPNHVTLDMFRTQYSLKAGGSFGPSIYYYYYFNRKVNRIGLFPRPAEAEKNWKVGLLLVSENSQSESTITSNSTLKLSDTYKVLLFHDRVHDSGVNKDSGVFGVPHILQQQWLLELPEKIYVQLLGIGSHCRCLLNQPLPLEAELIPAGVNERSGWDFCHDRDLFFFNKKKVDKFRKDWKSSTVRSEITNLSEEEVEELTEREFADKETALKSLQDNKLNPDFSLVRKTFYDLVAEFKLPFRNWRNGVLTRTKVTTTQEGLKEGIFLLTSKKGMASFIDAKAALEEFEKEQVAAKLREAEDALEADEAIAISLKPKRRPRKRSTETRSDTVKGKDDVPKRRKVNTRSVKFKSDLEVNTVSNDSALPLEKDTALVNEPILSGTENLTVPHSGVQTEGIQSSELHKFFESISNEVDLPMDDPKVGLNAKQILCVDSSEFGCEPIDLRGTPALLPNSPLKTPPNVPASTTSSFPQEEIPIFTPGLTEMVNNANELCQGLSSLLTQTFHKNGVLEFQIQTLELDKKDLCTRLESLKSFREESRKLRRANDELISENQRLKSDNRNLQSVNEELESVKERLQSEIADCKSKAQSDITQYEQTLGKQAAQIQELSSSFNDLKKEFSKFKLDAEEKSKVAEATLANSQQLLKEKSAQVIDQTVEIALLKRRKLQLVARVEELENYSDDDLTEDFVSEEGKDNEVGSDGGDTDKDMDDIQHTAGVEVDKEEENLDDETVKFNHQSVNHSAAENTTIPPFEDTTAAKSSSQNVGFDQTEIPSSEIDQSLDAKEDETAAEKKVGKLEKNNKWLNSLLSTYQSEKIQLINTNKDLAEKLSRNQELCRKLSRDKTALERVKVSLENDNHIFRSQADFSETNLFLQRTPTLCLEKYVVELEGLLSEIKDMKINFNKIKMGLLDENIALQRRLSKAEDSVFKIEKSSMRAQRTYEHNVCTFRREIRSLAEDLTHSHEQLISFKMLNRQFQEILFLKISERNDILFEKNKALRTENNNLVDELKLSIRMSRRRAFSIKLLQRDMFDLQDRVSQLPNFDRIVRRKKFVGQKNDYV